MNTETDFLLADFVWDIHLTLSDKNKMFMSVSCSTLHERKKKKTNTTRERIISLFYRINVNISKLLHLDPKKKGWKLTNPNISWNKAHHLLQKRAVVFNQGRSSVSCRIKERFIYCGSPSALYIFCLIFFSFFTI